MKILMMTAALAMIAASPSFAAGDAAAGEKVFKKCKACHEIKDPNGNVVVRGGRLGPNLWGVVGREIGSEEGYHYDKTMEEAKATGDVWTEDMIAAYVADPSGYMKELLKDSSAHVKMTFKLREGGADVAAYLATFH